MDQYEFVFIIEKEDNEILIKLENIIKNLSGEIIKKKPLGKKLFSYKIGKAISGSYYQWIIKLNRKDLVSLRRQIKVENLLLRYLLLKSED